MFYLVWFGAYFLPGFVWLLCSTWFVLADMFYLVCFGWYVLPGLCWLIFSTWFVLADLFYLVWFGRTWLSWLSCWPRVEGARWPWRGWRRALLSSEKCLLPGQCIFLYCFFIFPQFSSNFCFSSFLFALFLLFQNSFSVSWACIVIVENKSMHALESKHSPCFTFTEFEIMYYFENIWLSWKLKLFDSK